METTCWTCGHPLGTKMLGGMQDCPNCRQIDAINRQTKQMANQNQPHYNQPLGFTEEHASAMVSVFGKMIGWMLGFVAIMGVIIVVGAVIYAIFS